jgi:hypothetical protein
MTTTTMNKPAIDKRKLAIRVSVAAMILIPLYVGFKYIEPFLFRPAQQLFSRLPVTYGNLSPIPIRFRAIRTIPVRVIPKGANGIRVTYKNLSRIPITYKGGDEESMPSLPGLTNMRVQHRYSNGIQRPTNEE